MASGLANNTTRHSVERIPLPCHVVTGDHNETATCTNLT